MSIEGRLRDLGLPELLQLLALSRKTGVLLLQSPLQAQHAFVRLTNGAVVDAAQWQVADGVHEAPPGLAVDAAATQAVEQCVLELLTWRDGDFVFSPEDGKPLPSPVRIGVEMLLVASAQQAAAWERMADRVANASVIPTFVEVEPQQLPLLRLVPQQWEILTRVDGQRDLNDLAEALGREVLEVAEIVHGLIGAGLLTLREVAAAPRRNPTPPIGASAQTLTAPPFGAAEPPRRELRDPVTVGGDHADDDHGDEDSLFDPDAVGLLLGDIRPRRRTTPFAVTALVDRVHEATAVAVAPMAPETSVEGGEIAGGSPTRDALALSTQGDDAARRGDLSGALTLWRAALQSEASHPHADRIREAMALAAQLHALLHSAERRT